MSDHCKQKYLHGKTNERAKKAWLKTRKGTHNMGNGGIRNTSLLCLVWREHRRSSLGNAELHAFVDTVEGLEQTGSALEAAAQEQRAANRMAFLWSI